MNETENEKNGPEIETISLTVTVVGVICAALSFLFYIYAGPIIAAYGILLICSGRLLRRTVGRWGKVDKRIQEGKNLENLGIIFLIFGLVLFVIIFYFL